MRPLFWPSRRPQAVAIAAPAFRPSRDLVLAALVAFATMATSWATAMIAAFIILSR